MNECGKHIVHILVHIHRVHIFVLIGVLAKNIFKNRGILITGPFWRSKTYKKQNEKRLGKLLQI